MAPDPATQIGALLSWTGPQKSPTTWQAGLQRWKSHKRVSEKSEGGGLIRPPKKKKKTRLWDFNDSPTRVALSGAVFSSKVRRFWRPDVAPGARNKKGVGHNLVKVAPDPATQVGAFLGWTGP